MLGEPIIRLIYERGAFSSCDVSMTVWALSWRLSGLLGHATAFYALMIQNNWMTIALISDCSFANLQVIFRPIMASNYGDWSPFLEQQWQLRPSDYQISFYQQFGRDEKSNIGNGREMISSLPGGYHA